MVRRNTISVLAAVALGALLVSAGVAVAGVSLDDAPSAPTDAASNDSDRRTITVAASGRAEGEPDNAVLHLTVEARADDPATARTWVAENATRMREALRDYGLADEQIRTAGFHIGRDHSRPRSLESEGDVTYVARHFFEIELADVDAVGEVIDVAVDNGASRIESVQFTLSEDSERMLRRAALRDAMANARNQSETIAESAGVTIARMHSASTTDVRVPSPRVHLEAAMAGDAAGTSLEPGSVTVTVTVTVEYDVAD